MPQRQPVWKAINPVVSRLSIAVGYSKRFLQNYFAKRHLVFAVIQIGGVGLAIYFAVRPPAPGYAIGLLAFLAAVMTVHLEMIPAHRFVWSVLLAAFLVIEIQAIRIDRAESVAKETARREDESDQFKKVLDAQNLTFAANQANFADAIGRLEFLTNEQTGGNSIPILYNSDARADADGGVTLELRLVGKYALPHLRVAIYPRNREPARREALPDQNRQTTWELPELTRFSNQAIPPIKIYPRLNPGDGEEELFDAVLSTRNTAFLEKLSVTENKYRQYTVMWKLYDGKGKLICEADNQKNCS